ncbi:MAG: hypothetical protein JWN17_2973 [Frankiales bacterium]|nr:hypothetical protein [Frankiales bacterium]
MRHLRLLTAATLVLSPLALLLPATAAAPAPGGLTPAWTTPVALDSGGAEPSIRVAPDGRSAAYVSAPGPSGSSFWRIDEAVDSAGYTHLTPSKGVQPDLGTGGGDAEISVGTAVDPATGCAPIAYSGLHNIDLLDNFTVAQSTDCGKTFSLLNPYATQNTLTDRQWQAFDGTKTNHLLYHKVDTGQIVDSRSEDGGQTYLTLGTPAGATGVVDPAHSFTIQNVKVGNVVADLSRPVAGQTYPISGEQVHTLWATFAGSRDAADAAMGAAGSNVPGGTDHMDTVYVARSDDGGVTWTDTASYTTPTDSTRELDLIFPVIAVDSRGGLYSAWTDGNLVQVASSTDGGTTWSAPYTVDPGLPGAQKSGGTADLFPWIAAGAPGRLDVVWYHGKGGDTSGYRNVGTAETTWTVAFAQLAAADTAAPTVVARDYAVTPVMHTGNVCNNGTTCGITDTGDRTLLDFFQVAVDGQGRANIAYAADQGSAGTAHVEYTRQNSGASLLDGSPVRPAVFAPAAGDVCTPDAPIADPAGDATGAALVDSTPAPSQDDLDVTRAFFTTSADGSSLTTHVKVKDLTATGGQYFRYSFSYGTAQYLTTASRGVSGTTSYALSASGTTGSTTLKAVTGSFDPDTDEVTVTFSLEDFNSTAKPTAPLAAGAALGGQQVLAQRSAGAGATLTSDTAAGTCPYVVGAAPATASPTASPSASPTVAYTPASSSPRPSPSGPAPTASSPAAACSTGPVDLPTRVLRSGASAPVRLSGPAGAVVDLLAYTRPSTTFRVVRTVTLGPDGTSSVTLTPPSNTRMAARQRGCSVGPSAALTVTATLSLDAHRTGARTYRFAGNSLPKRAGGLAVALYRVDARGHEVLTARTRTDGSTGTWSLTRRFSGAGRFGFVLRTGTDASNAAGASAVRTVQVR